MQCQQDIFIGIFFDGTGNNKYRDTGGFKHSNVARLYEAYTGTAFAETPSLGPGGGGKTADLPPAWPATLPAAERPYYRKLYIPGLGTPFPELGDNLAGTGRRLCPVRRKTPGLDAAAAGQPCTRCPTGWQATDAGAG